MNKKEFIFPGIILGTVLIIAAGLLLTQGRETTPPIGSGSASSTITSSSDDSALTPSSGASTQTPTSYYPYGTTVLSLNQAAQFKSGVSIRPMAVLQDSRCPADVQCIQAGTVEIALRVNGKNESKLHNISLNESVVVDGTTITFTSVEPAKVAAGTKPASSAYRFTFTVEAPTTSAGQCYVGGCSSEVCSDTPNMASNCIYTPAFACYRTAKCERQVTGKCGWTQTDELKKCLANPPTE